MYEKIWKQLVGNRDSQAVSYKDIRAIAQRFWLSSTEGEYAQVSSKTRPQVPSYRPYYGGITQHGTRKLCSAR